MPFAFAMTLIAASVAQTPAANTVAWHGVLYDASKAADKLMVDFKLTPSTSWSTLDAKGKLDELFKARQVAVPTLFNSINDRVDMALNDLAKTVSVNRDELTASYLLETLDPPADSKSFQVDTLYVLLREFKNTVASLKIYAAILDRTLKSESPNDSVLFMEVFPNSAGSAAVIGHLFELQDRIAQLSRRNGDYANAFNAYTLFLTKSADPSMLTQIAAERSELCLLECLSNLAVQENMVWDGQAISDADFIMLCDNYIVKCAGSTERVKWVADIAATIQLREWDACKGLIQDTDAQAAPKISAFFLDIAAQGVFAYNAASVETDFSKKLLYLSRAARSAGYLKTAQSGLAAQFPTNIQARGDALNALSISAKGFIYSQIFKQLDDCNTLIKANTDSLVKIEANTDELNKKVSELSTELATSFAAVNTSLAAVQANLVTLNKTAEETLKVTRAGFTDVNTHLKAANQKLDGLVDQVRVSNGLLTQLNVDLNFGFEAVKGTIVEVSHKDLNNYGYWQVRGEGLRRYVVEKSTSIWKAVLGLFGIFSCEVDVFADSLSLPSWARLREHHDCDITTSHENQYQVYKKEVLTKFIDPFEMVCNIQKTATKSEFIDQGDCAWRTSLLLSCLAMEGDNANCQRFLTALDKCWIDGVPHRSPDPTLQSKTVFSSDQFVVEWSAIYLCYRYGDSTTKLQARNLAERFINKLARDDWKLTEDKDAHFNSQRSGGRFIVMLVAREMGIDRIWKDELDASLYGFYRSLWFAGADWLRSYEAAMKTPEEPSSFHNLFWEVLLVSLCEGNSEDLDRLICHLGVGSEKQNMGLFMWLDHNGKQPCKWLDSWPDNWSVRDYVWQRSKKQNENAPHTDEEYPRLDFMTLVRLVASKHPH